MSRNETTTISYVNIYHEKDGHISYGMFADSPEEAASFVCIADGVPISLVKVEFDMRKPVGKRIIASEIVQ